jgi:hypothetical protein
MIIRHKKKKEWGKRQIMTTKENKEEIQTTEKAMSCSSGNILT